MQKQISSNKELGSNALIASRTPLVNTLLNCLIEDQTTIFDDLPGTII